MKTSSVGHPALGAVTFERRLAARGRPRRSSSGASWRWLEARRLLRDMRVRENILMGRRRNDSADVARDLNAR